MATRRAQTGPAQSYATVIAGGSVLGAGAAVFFGYPGLAVIWVALMVAGCLEQAPMFTGKKDQRGFPTPAHPGEQKAMNTYRFWTDLRWRLACPTLDWLPGWPVLGSWLAGLAAGGLATFLPVKSDLPQSLVWVNVGAAFIVTVQVAASRRRTVAEDDVCPGTRTDSLKLLIADTKNAIGLGAATVAVIGVVVYASLTFTPQWFTVTGPVGSLTPLAFPLVLALAAAGGVIAYPWQTASLATWRELVKVRREWAPRWQMLKQDPAPFLTGHKMVGPATVDTFDAPPQVGAAFFYTQSGKITPTLGTNMKVAVLEVPNADGQGQPVPGTQHPLRFDVVMWPADQIPDISTPGTEPAVAELLIRSSMGWAADMIGFARFILTGCHLITEADSPVVWATQWVGTQEIGLSWVRNQANGALSGGARVPVLTDHRAMGGAGLVFFGAVLDPATVYAEGSGITTESMGFIAEEDEWRGRWAAVLKQNVNAPVPQFPVKAQAQLADGTTVHHQPFVTLSGEDPAQFMVGLEGKLAATIPGSAPFMSVAWYTQRGTDRSGDRHAQAFTVSYADKPVPSLFALAPTRGDAPRWVISGHVNDAFTAARLSRPEVLAVQCLTAPTSREHIWQVTIRLYGGVTLSDVRGAATRIKTALGVKWLRVAPQTEGCVIFAGGEPAKVKLARPERDTPRLVALDWEQAWLDSKVGGVAGLLPTLTEVAQLPHNDAVQVLDFDLTAGIALSDIKAAVEKLKTATGNSFIEVRDGTHGAASVRLLVCETSPMPDFAPFDFAAIDEADDIPFAAGVEGEPIAYDFGRDPHLLIVGGTGSGKSATLQALMYAMLVRGCDMYVADPTKGGADFRFVLPWVKSFTVDVFDAAAMMNGVYAEVLRRKSLNAEHGVGSYMDLPEELRPRHAVVILDEFTSLMMADAVTKPDPDDEEGVREYEHQMALNAAKRMIGSKAGRIAREARSAGVTLLLATQRLTAKTLDTIPGASDLRSNMSRLILGKATFGELQSALKDPQAAPLLGDVVPRGRGLIEVSGERTQMLQSWYAAGMQQVLGEHLLERRAPLLETEKLDLAPFMPARGDAPAGDSAFSRYEDPEPVVVELDTFEMSLDDLDDDAAQTPEEALPAWAREFAAATHHGTATVPVGPVPLDDDPFADQYDDDDVQVDVDPFADDADLDVEGAPDLGDDDMNEHATTVVFLGGAATPDAVDRLGTWPAAVVTLTALPEGTGDVLGWGKLEAVTAWLDANPDITDVVWFDPQMDDLDDLDVPYRDLAAEVLDARSVTHELAAAALVDVALLTASEPSGPPAATPPAPVVVPEPVVELEPAMVAEPFVPATLTASLPARGNAEMFAGGKVDIPRTSMVQQDPAPELDIAPVPATAVRRPAGVTMTAPLPDEW